MPLQNGLFVWIWYQMSFKSKQCSSLKSIFDQQFTIDLSDDNFCWQIGSVYGVIYIAIYYYPAVMKSIFNYMEIRHKLKNPTSILSCRAACFAPHECSFKKTWGRTNDKFKWRRPLMRIWNMSWNEDRKWDFGLSTTTTNGLGWKLRQAQITLIVEKLEFHDSLHDYV
jgi:hypothetical protein